MLSTYRLFLHIGVATVGLVALSATASAHAGIGDGSAPAAFAVVVGLPVVTGVLGGSIAIRHRRITHCTEGRRRTSIALGLLLVVLGGTLTLTALAKDLSVAIAGGTVGAIAAMGIARRERTGMGCSGHTHLTLGAVCVHRVFEGAVLGALYSTGAVVGIVGAIVLAGHTALETAVVGGLYATATRRSRAVGAILLVQAGYLVGGITGLGVAIAIPVGVRTLALAVVGGVLVFVGVGETERSVTAIEPTVIE